MRFIQIAAIGIVFSLFGYKISAESLSDIYQLALENDAQLKAEGYIQGTKRAKICCSCSATAANQCCI